jgi:hypothetical protein
MSYEEHAKREFKLMGYIPLEEEQEDGPNKWMQENILELLRVFYGQGHSGFSAPYCIDLFAKLALFKPILPLEGTDDEWEPCAGFDGNPSWQNIRYPQVFRDLDGRAYDSKGRVFREPDGCCYTNSNSRIYIDFPYTPKTEYVDVSENRDE